MMRLRLYFRYLAYAVPQRLWRLPLTVVIGVVLAALHYRIQTHLHVVHPIGFGGFSVYVGLLIPSLLLVRRYLPVLLFLLLGTLLVASETLPSLYWTYTVAARPRKLMRLSTVTLVSAPPRTVLVSGRGYMLPTKDVITARHLWDSPSPLSTFAQPLPTVYGDPDHDVMALSIEAHAIPQISGTTPKSGDVLYVLESNSTLRLHPIRVTHASPREIAEMNAFSTNGSGELLSDTYFAVDDILDREPVRHGYSGSPVFLANGTFVGILLGVTGLERPLVIIARPEKMRFSPAMEYTQFREQFMPAILDQAFERSHIIRFFAELSLRRSPCSSLHTPYAAAAYTQDLEVLINTCGLRTVPEFNARIQARFPQYYHVLHTPCLQSSPVP